jgi:hypothetical protein
MVSAQAMFLSLANETAAPFYGLKHAHLHHHKRFDQTRKVPWSWMWPQERPALKASETT